MSLPTMLDWFAGSFRGAADHRGLHAGGRLTGDVVGLFSIALFGPGTLYNEA